MLSTFSHILNTKKTNIYQAYKYNNVCYAAVWVFNWVKSLTHATTLSIIYIFIHQYGSAQKENTNIQTKSSIKTH